MKANSLVYVPIPQITVDYNKAEAETVRLIKQELSQGRDWNMATQVTHLPYQGTRDKYFLLINLNVNPGKSDRDSLYAGALAVAQAVIRSTLLSDEKAIEVSVWVDSAVQKSPRRVFRLSILDTAFAAVMQVSMAELQANKQEGITCYELFCGRIICRIVVVKSRVFWPAPS